LELYHISSYLFNKRESLLLSPLYLLSKRQTCLNLKKKEQLQRGEQEDEKQGNYIKKKVSET
jgi:hypothetical protein